MFDKIFKTFSAEFYIITIGERIEPQKKFENYLIEYMA
jgi:hypothetical protein